MFKITTTWKARYDGLGIPNYILQHFGHADQKLVIVDVGCSDGRALTECKECLSSKNIEVYAVGIDPCKSEATTSNLDEFIRGYTADAGHYVGKADVVICVNVLNAIHRNPKQVFRDAANLLKIGGVMITDAYNTPSEYKAGLSQRSDFKRTLLCCSKYSVSYLINIGNKMKVYEKMK